MPTIKALFAHGVSLSRVVGHYSGLLLCIGFDLRRYDNHGLAERTVAHFILLRHRDEA